MKDGLKDGHNKKTTGKKEVAASRRQREKEEGEEFQRSERNRRERGKESTGLGRGGA